MLKAAEIPFEEQIRYKIAINDKTITTYVFDYLIDKKIVVDLKIRNRFTKEDMRQAIGYLKESRTELGILIAFTKFGVKFHRMVFQHIS